MDLLYSLALLVSLTAGAVSLLAGLVAVVGAWRPSPADSTDSPVRRLGQLTKVGVLVALSFAVLSAGVHLGFGHRPGSPEELGAVAFLAIHPAYFGALAIAAVAVLLALLASKRLARSTGSSCS